MPKSHVHCELQESKARGVALGRTSTACGKGYLLCRISGIFIGHNLPGLLHSESGNQGPNMECAVVLGKLKMPHINLSANPMSKFMQNLRRPKSEFLQSPEEFKIPTT